MEIISCDLAIIGGGAAGLRAAIAAAEKHLELRRDAGMKNMRPKLNIALISKVYPVRSHTVSAEGGIAGVLPGREDPEGDSVSAERANQVQHGGQESRASNISDVPTTSARDTFESHAFDTIRGSDFLADQDAVEFFVKEAPKEIIQLEHWGCPWSRQPDGKIALRAFGGMSAKRTVFAADKTGFYMLHSLFERTLLHPNIKRFDEWFVTKLLRDDQGIAGCVAMDMKGGKFAAFQAKAVLLATGGAGKIYSFTTNGNIKTGDGMALALHAGAPLKDMEFVQFHPTGLPRTGILITEAARGEGGYLLNNKGERFMHRYLPNKMELGPRDIISRSIMSEIKAGRGFEGPHGKYVHLDIRHLGEKVIDERLPLVREISRDFAGVDPVKEPIPVMPVAHYFMGGVHTNMRAETPIPGLFAAGETACVSINGANRLGSNSLAECLVFGKVAGENAAEFAQSNDVILNPESKFRAGSFQDLAKDEETRLSQLINNEGLERLAPLREKLQNAMQEHAGIEREKKSLTEALRLILELRERAANISLQDRSLVFNTEFLGVLELRNMLDVAEGVARAAIAREESRGSHFRSDFPKRDDEKFLKHILVKKENGNMLMEESPVKITQWQPQERKY